MEITVAEATLRLLRTNPGQALWSHARRHRLQNATCRDIHLDDSVVLHRAYKSVTGIRQDEQPFRKLAGWNPPDDATSRDIENDQFIAARICDPDELSVGSEFDARGAIAPFRKGLSNSVGGRINDRNRVALVIANPNFTAVWRDINANGLPTQ
jgi:hypothetical protein